MFFRSDVPGVKKIIAVGAGKGGVGKSVVASYLALLLQKKGFSVGLLDCDITGPSIPAMFGADDEKMVAQNGKVLPIVKNGLKIASIGFLIKQTSAAIWRGPMLSKAIKQLFECFWNFDGKDCDFLILDLPPGTSDVHLAVLQNYMVHGAVLVTTLHKISIIDTLKAANMFEKLSVRVLGLVKNMCYIYNDSRDQKIYPFGNNASMLKGIENDEDVVVCEMPILSDIVTQTAAGKLCITSDIERALNAAVDKVLTR